MRTRRADGTVCVRIDCSFILMKGLLFLTSCPIQTLQNPDLQSDNVAVSMQMRAFAARRGRSVDNPYRTTHAL